MPMNQTDTIHAAYVDNPKYEPKRSWFVSLDGDSWLPVSDDPRGADAEEVRKFFAPPGKGFLPMTMGRNFLHALGSATFFDGDPDAS